MSFVTTYILTIHDEDVENITNLNQAIAEHYVKMNHALTSRAFKDMGWKLQRHDASEFWAANLNNFRLDDLTSIIDSLDWNFKYAIRLMYKTENMKSWITVTPHEVPVED